MYYKFANLNKHHIYAFGNVIILVTTTMLIY